MKQIESGMKAEEKPSESTGQEDTWTIVTTEEFGTVDIDAPIRDSRNVDCWSLGDLFLRAAHEQREQGNGTAFRVYGLLSEIARMHLKPRDRSEPYGPLFVMDGRRSLIPSDLEGEQSAVIGRLVPGIRNPGLRARLADIVWHNDRKCADMARQAIGAYTQAVQSVLDGNAEFFRGNTVAGCRDGCRMLYRASHI